jgi:hypothetical protein
LSTFISIESNKLVVRLENGEKRKFPLNKTGCKQAGKELFLSGAESWLYSSSVDFAQEYGYRGNYCLRYLIEAGHQKELEKAEAPRQSVLEKMVKWCSETDFCGELSGKEEVDAFKKIKKEIGA